MSAIAAAPDLGQARNPNAPTHAAVPLVRLEKVGQAFDSGAVVALREVDLVLRPSECVSIVGRSGSGKTSLLNIISGFDAPSSGCVYWRERPVLNARSWAALRRREIGIVFQEFLLFAALTAAENVEMPMIGTARSGTERARRARELLDQVGLSARLDHLPHQLSGGERQRVAIARSIANEPALLLADEPTGSLDSANAEAVMALLFEIQRARGMTLVIVTHDEALAERTQRLIRLKDGRVVDDSGHSQRHAPSASDL